MKKEQRIYLDGMAFAYRICKEQGIEALEHEMKFRGVHDIPLNVDHKDVIKMVRGQQWDELMIVATASAATLSEDLHLPPTMTKKYLEGFSGRTDLFREDKEAFEAAQDRLNRDFGMNTVCEQFKEEYKNGY